MKKNKIMRLASALLVLTLMTTCAISSTFAKYTTSTNGEDSARVAKWGFTDTNNDKIELANLFNKAYDTTVESTTDVIAPGTTNSAKFAFTYGGSNAATAPEVSYTFTVDTTGSTCDNSIAENKNILWKLDEGTWGTWDQLITAIKSLSGNATGTETYGPGQLPTGFNATGNNEHTVAWKWVFDENAANKEADTTNLDTTDTGMGNATALANVKLVVKITATQVD